MLKRILALIVLGAAAAACNPGATPTPTLTLSTPGPFESPSALPVESPLTSP
jgi:hypothetical protein